MAMQQALNVMQNASGCGECFKLESTLTRCQSDQPKPRWIGSLYWNSRPRLVLVLINPGTSLDESVLRREKVAFESFYATGMYTPVYEYFRFRRERESLLPRNRHFIKVYEDVFGIDFERIALINVAWCPTLGDKYPKWMLDKCMRLHTLSLLHALEPDAVLLSGKKTHVYQSLLEAELPKARIRPTYHFARGVLRSKAIHEGPSVRKWLEDIADNISERGST